MTTTTTTDLLDKTMTEDEVVSRLESGMTIGIGGWAARRKPMSIIRAIVRSGLTDLTVAAYGGADVGMLCAAGKVPALKLDAAIVHLNRCDERGNAAFLGPDLYFDDLLLEAAEAGYVSCEQLVTTEELAAEAPLHTMRTNRMFVTGVVEAPNGAHPASCVPDHDVDADFLRTYAGAAKSPEAWDEFRSTYLSGTEADYQETIR